MPAIQVAAQCTFPKQLMKLMLFDAVLQHGMVEFEHHPFIKAQTFAHHGRCLLPIISTP
jgi:hypothetical protein